MRYISGASNNCYRVIHNMISFKALCRALCRARPCNLLYTRVFHLESKSTANFATVRDNREKLTSV